MSSDQSRAVLLAEHWSLALCLRALNAAIWATALGLQSGQCAGERCGQFSVGGNSTAGSERAGGPPPDVLVHIEPSRDT